MHQSSYNIMTQFMNLTKRHFKVDKIKVLDVGSYGVNGTYREIFSDANKFIYTGLDVNPGPNVDYVPQDPYIWPEMEDEFFDVIISGQAFEHIEFPWLIINQMSIKLKQNGLICIIAPSRGPEHKFPVDCWRYYPDGFRALAKWAGLEVMETSTMWGASGFSDGSDQWGDTFCILHKASNKKPEYCIPPVTRTINRNSPLSSSKQNTYYSFARNEVVDAIVSDSIPAKRILEIGCAEGATAKRLKELLSVEYYVGVEISEEAAGIAKQHLDKVIAGNIEKMDMAKDCGLKQRDFDLVLALDVLEHLYNPWDVLATFSDYLKPGGHVVASIPNIQNISIIKDLINGKWKYEDAGILDVTHLRFFTLHEIERMFSGAGLSIKKTNPVLNPPIDISSLKETGNLFNHENLSITDLSKEEVLNLFTYQYIIIAKKPDVSDIPATISPEKTNTDSDTLHGIKGSAMHWEKDATPNLTSIVILTFNQLKYTKECVESIKKYTPEPHEIIFVDNGSTDGTIKWLRQLIKQNSNYKLIENNKNLGFAKGCNQGITESAGEFILLLNNDVVVTEGWLSGLLECLKSSSDTGIVGPMTNNISGIQRIQNVGYISIADMNKYAMSFREKNRHRRIPLRRIVGFCMLFRRSLVEKTGLMDESFGTGNFEDDDFCLRAAIAGYRNIVAGDVFIHHYGSISFSGNKINYDSAMSGNMKIFSQKWSTEKEYLVVNMIDNASSLYEEGKLDEAVDILLKGIAISHNEAKIYYALAEILIDSKQYKNALEAVNEMPSYKDDMHANILAGYSREGMGLDAEAEESADKILSSNPESALALNLKGILAYKNGDLKAAEEYFNKSIKSDKGYGRPYTNLGVLKWASGLTEEAFDCLEKGFLLSPTLADNSTLYHQAILETGKFATAEPILREAADLYPNNRKISFLLIDVMLKQEKFTEAMNMIEEAMVKFGIDDGILAAALEVRRKIGIKKIDSPSVKKGTVSLCMIVKNEEECLHRCLKSIKPLVDEMIVVDTGSTDKTKDIAEAFGAKIYDFQWTNNFAEARNFSISKASGQWILVLDADEVISSLDHRNFNNIIEKTKSENVAFLFITRNYIPDFNTDLWNPNEGRYILEEKGAGWIPSTKARLFPNVSSIRYENPVHEMVEPSLNSLNIPLKEIGIPVHHYGKLNLERTAEKWEKYYLLGKKKLEETGGDIQAICELAIQAGELKRFDEAIELWQKALTLSPNLSIAFMSMGHIYMEMDNFKEAIASSKRAMELKSDEWTAIINYALGELYGGDIKNSISALEDLLRKKPEHLLATTILSAAYSCNGQTDKGLGCIKKIKQNQGDFAGSFYNFAKRLISIGRIYYATLLLEAALEYGALNLEIRELLADCHTRTNHSQKQIG